MAELFRVVVGRPTTEVAARACRTRKKKSHVWNAAECLFVAMSCFLCGCADSRNTVLDLRLDDGRVVHELIRKQGLTAVLLYDATTCLSCKTPLPYWEAAAREGRINIVVLLAGKLTEADRRVLRIQRVPVTGFLTQVSSGFAFPSEYLLRDGSIIASAIGTAAVYKQRLWMHSPVVPVADSSSAVHVSTKETTGLGSSLSQMGSGLRSSLLAMK